MLKYDPLKKPFKKLLEFDGFYNWPGPNPAIVCYNASAVTFYNTTSGPVHFEMKKILF
jgi:hypothetical protein